MTPIRGRVELLLARARRMPETVPKWVVQGLERLEQLVDAYIRRATTLLDVSRINSGNLFLKPAELDVSALVRQAVIAMTPTAERAGSGIALKLQDGIIGRQHWEQDTTSASLRKRQKVTIRVRGAVDCVMPQLAAAG